MFSVLDKVRRNILVSSDHGLMIVNRFDYNHERVGQGQWLLDHGSASSVEAYETYKCISHIKEPIIFDIGANIGTYATWITKLFPNGKIYCFEPQRLVFQILCGNFAINNYDNCYTYNIALGSKNDIIEIEEPNYNQNENFGSFSLIEDRIKSKSGQKYSIQMMTLDNFVSVYNIDKVDFIKIDVEGMDLEVLKGTENILKKYKPSIFIEYSDTRKSILPEIINYLGADNYYFKTIENNLLAKPK